MNRYFTYMEDENILAFVELDNELYCWRAIFYDGEKIICTSLVMDFLPEKSYDEALDKLTEITKAEFLEHWGKAKLPYQQSWDKVKNEVRIGQKTRTVIVCFYPQGVVLKSSETFYGIANYDECKKHFGEEKMYSSVRLDLEVEGFDDDYMWIKFKINSK